MLSGIRGAHGRRQAPEGRSAGRIGRGLELGGTIMAGCSDLGGPRSVRHLHQEGKAGSDCQGRGGLVRQVEVGVQWFVDEWNSGQQGDTIVERHILRR